MITKYDIKSGKLSDSYIIIVFYITVQVSEGHKENINKYETLGSLISKLKDERIILIGDKNVHARINKLKLISFAENYNFEILNCTIGRGRVIWSSREHESAIDYILVGKWMG